MRAERGFGPILGPRALAKWKKDAETMSNDQEAAIRTELLQMREEHRDLDMAIRSAEESRPGAMLEIQRLKKRKLFLKDRISALEDRLTPDIIA
jgi:hypothetical protein